LVLDCIEVQPSRRPSMNQVAVRLNNMINHLLTLSNVTGNILLSETPMTSSSSSQSEHVEVEVVKMDAITDEQLLSLPVLPMGECTRDSFIIGRDDNADFSANVLVVFHHPTADFRVVLTNVTVHQNTLEVKFQGTESPFNSKYRHNLAKVLKGTQAEIVVQAFVLLSNGTPIGRCRVGILIQWMGLNCQVLRFFSPPPDYDHEDDEDASLEKKAVKIKRVGKSRFWITLPLDWEKIVQDTTK